MIARLLLIFFGLIEVMMMRRVVPVFIVFVILLNSCAFLQISPGKITIEESPPVSNAEPENREESKDQDQTENESKKSVENNDENTVDEPSDGVDPAQHVVETPIVVNPLSGLPVENPENLLLPPALVSVTNFPPTARPQAGLATSPIVFELYIGDGMTRYLAIFYGDFPTSEVKSQSGEVPDDMTEVIDEPVIGPIRSGRIPYEHIRKLFNGFIVMASAYSRVADQLVDFVNVFGDDHQDVNSALIAVDELEAIAQANEKKLGEAALTGMVFDASVPESGKDAHSIWVYYAFKNQVFWRYNEEDGSYHRWQDNADGETFIEQTDRLTGEPLTFENVIVLLVDHHVDQKYYIDLDLLYRNREKALLFRDGKVQEIYWTTKSEEYEQTTGKLRPIRFIDVDGNPISLKPGQTWIELMPTHSPIWETVDSEKYHILLNGRSKGSGYWAVWYKVNY